MRVLVSLTILYLGVVLAFPSTVVDSRDRSQSLSPPPLSPSKFIHELNYRDQHLNHNQLAAIGSNFDSREECNYQGSGPSSHWPSGSPPTYIPEQFANPRRHSRIETYPFGDASPLPKLGDPLIPSPPRQYDRVGMSLYQALPHNSSVKRYHLIGDVHGQNIEFQKLMVELKYNKNVDQLILVGDLIHKGSYSIEVLDFAIANKALCVRGNHEDYLFSIVAEQKLGKYSRKWRDTLFQLIKELKDHHWAYLRSCPLVLQLPKEFGNIAVVHAGIDMNQALERQDPDVAMYTPILTPNPNGGPPERTEPSWFDIYNARQEERRMHKTWSSAESRRSPPMTVVYGHDELLGLQLHPFTKGLDSACYRGGSLTALTLPGQKITSVKCKPSESMSIRKS
ncbi:hypothetical protein H4R33_003723 [Dimargaris cristalligena]|uniref:Metallo-dependent phosphatase-like protein n=1 Tax=Dimargaris cristalligena TaxID=215637 RepID=A0A4P9ZXU4_9FUNG|nr:hypothetical protein H4R33_003723 [Dimargaris cristalligena]RKP37861.1 Metallo-dependent phosphatase-like protein [Dimargaris cristalligena]|eukprot:RKP37861.1 Metallo-dependent phosphatase-like protein [Dimargaris cristalligena]